MYYSFVPLNLLQLIFAEFCTIKHNHKSRNAHPIVPSLWCFIHATRDWNQLAVYRLPGCLQCPIAIVADLTGPSNSCDASKYLSTWKFTNPLFMISPQNDFFWGGGGLYGVYSLRPSARPSLIRSLACGLFPKFNQWEFDVSCTIPAHQVISQGRTNRSNFCGRGGNILVYHRSTISIC